MERPAGEAATKPGPPPPALPPSDIQVTPNGQVATSYPNTETIYALNLKRAAQKAPFHHEQTLAQLQRTIRGVTHAEAQHDPFNIENDPAVGGTMGSRHDASIVVRNLPTPSGTSLPFDLALPHSATAPHRAPPTLLLTDTLPYPLKPFQPTASRARASTP